MTDTPTRGVLFSAASDVEGAAIALDDVNNLLHILWELLQDAEQDLDPQQPYTSQLLKNRFPLLLSLLVTEKDSLQQQTADILAATDRLYEAARIEHKEVTNADN